MQTTATILFGAKYYLGQVNFAQNFAQSGQGSAKHMASETNHMVSCCGSVSTCIYGFVQTGVERVCVNVCANKYTHFVARHSCGATRSQIAKQ